MAKYTLELRSIQADFYASMQDYPIFDETYREKLNDKIYHALKYREIGYETPELFCEMLEQWMDLHMPEYNWLYKANLIELTPLQRAKILELSRGITDTKEDSTTDVNEANNGTSKDKNIGETTQNSNNRNTVDSTTTDSGTGSSNTTDSGESHGTSTSTTYNSDFPQANLDDKTDSNYYTTGSTTSSKSDDTNSANSNTTSQSQSTSKLDTTNTTDSNVKTNSDSTTDREFEDKKESKEVYDMKSQVVDTIEKQRTGNESKTDFELLDEYRKSFLNVDAKLIRALKRELFLNIW